MPERGLRTMMTLTAAFTLLAALVLLAAGCGGGSDPTADASAAASTTPAAPTRDLTRHPATAVPARTPRTTRSTVPSTFAAHAALAFGVFHKWISTPEKTGQLNQPKTHAQPITRAIAAAALVLSQTTLVRQAATGHPSLTKTLAPLAAIERTITAIKANLATHNPNLTKLTAAAIQYTNQQIQAIETTAKTAHQPITETTTGARI